jgi:hypothetical protein
MVTNSFGKRNFMQPNNGKAQACTEGALNFLEPQFVFCVIWVQKLNEN